MLFDAIRLGRVHSKFRPNLSHKVASRETYVKVNKRILRQLEVEQDPRCCPPKDQPRPQYSDSESDSSESESDSESSSSSGSESDEGLTGNGSSAIGSENEVEVSSMDEDG